MDYDIAVEKLHIFTEPLRAVKQNIKERVKEIRIIAGKPVMLCCGDRLYFLMQSGTVSDTATDGCLIAAQSDIDAVFHRLCGYSVYSHMDEIRSGFISVDRSLRVGIFGTAVLEEGRVRTVRGITGFCVRIPREVVGCAEKLLRAGLRPERGVLLAGAPSSGKTTVLRDLARILGNAGHSVAVLDERFELLADGFDLGVCTQVLQGYPKAAGYAHAVRCLAPEYILCDELGDGDINAVKQAAFTGAAMAATVHAGSRDELYRRPLCRELLESGIFGYVVLLPRDVHADLLPQIIRAGDVLEGRDDFSAYPVRFCRRAV